MPALQRCLGAVVDSPAKVRELVERSQVDPSMPEELTVVMKYNRLYSGDLTELFVEISRRVYHRQTSGTIMAEGKEVARFQAKQVAP